MESQALEQLLVNTFVPKIAQDRMYQTIDTYATGTTVLYSSGKPLEPAENFGIGPGLAREIPGTDGLIERFRYDDHEPFGQHLNYEIIVSGKDRKPIIDNHHIPLE